MNSMCVRKLNKENNCSHPPVSIEAGRMGPHTAYVMALHTYTHIHLKSIQDNKVAITHKAHYGIYRMVEGGRSLEGVGKCGRVQTGGQAENKGKMVDGRWSQRALGRARW